MLDRPLPVIVNRNSGGASAAGDALAGRIEAAFATVGRSIDLHIVEGSEIAPLVCKASHGGRIVVAGGDGTIACTAQQLAGSDCDVALLPLGTLNHLARDLAIPAEMDEAARLAATGRAAAIDVANVNGHRFVNNASIGLYPSMVRGRDDRRERRRWPKWLATVPAAWTALARLAHHRLRVDMGAGLQPLVTSLLFVGNNHYALEAGQVGKRTSLIDGQLSVFAVAHRSRLGLIWFALRALVGLADREADFVMIGDCPALTVHSSSGSVELALDGELQRLQSPLKFTVEPGALQIVAPIAEDSAAENSAEAP